MNTDMDMNTRGDTDGRVVRALIALALTAGFIWIAWRAFDALDLATRSFMTGALFGAAVIGIPSWLLLLYMRSKYHDETDQMRAQVDHARQQTLNMQAYMLQQAAGSRLLEAQMSQLFSGLASGIRLNGASPQMPLMPGSGYDGDDLDWPELPAGGK